MDNILSLKNISVQINRQSIFENVSFDVKKGDIILLSGENGTGKSTLLKSILGLREKNKTVTGIIEVEGYGDVLQLDQNDLQKYRSHIVYVQQKDEFSGMGDVQVRDIVSDCEESFSGKCLSYSEVNALIDEWIPRKKDNTRVFDAKSKPAYFSGGEQRLLSVFSIIATRKKSPFMIIDEPLNNLDFINARNISNLINKVIRENPEMGLIMVSHCRIFPFVNREIKLTTTGVIELSEPYLCHSCFGEADRDGYYLV